MLDLPPELQNWITDGMHRICLHREAAIRSLPTPPLAQVSTAARRYFFENNVFCLCTEPVDQYQKRCRRAMRKFEPQVSGETTALLDLISHKDVQSIRKIVILRGEDHCMPHMCRYWMTAVHIKEGLLSNVEVEEECELELLPSGGLEDHISVSFMDWSVVPQPVEILNDWSKEARRTLSRTPLKRFMQKMCGWR